MGDKIIIRVQSCEGTKRIQTTKSESTDKFLEKVCAAFNLASSQYRLYTDREKTKEIKQTAKPISTFKYKLKHGDLLSLVVLDSPRPPGGDKGMPVIEDEIDVFLNKQDGKVDRGPDPKYCQHRKREKCIHCTPLDPWDEGHLREQNIKHMSFHSYVRKLTCGVDKGKFAMLENISCKIKPGCTEHMPWPGGICTKCQPNAVTLSWQPYRHIDNASFENGHVVECFLDFWRKSGQQRFGYLYGRYEHHKDVPLGIKATVAAIYEPPQIGTDSSIELLDDDREEAVNQVAKELGLVRVGCIFSDLVADDTRRGTVKHFRNMQTHFLSAEESILAGRLQNQHPSPCKLSPDGHFGSKFVTIVISGDKENQVHMEGYQVSNQCMALVGDDILVPTKDAPELGYIRESTNEQYVPDVFFTEKDTYGNKVTQLARPLPIEYLLIDVPVSTPLRPQHTFRPPPLPAAAAAAAGGGGGGHRAFPIENRRATGDAQDFHALAAYVRQFAADAGSETRLEAMSDFHLLVFLATADMLPLRGKMSPLLTAVRTKDADLAAHWCKSEEWGTVEQLIQAQGLRHFDDVDNDGKC
ncbi:PREDICTED: nuclear protein localization protein 4 homolog [Priapulus caudatus]|uniref:Nuclear protein localization protein 4 homolog n=1 Tax=Priapulus caudatus TaxID=37621 RepID=A0ABM1E0Q2_PRICU|nr:PREDICTED: nuclear protein localization protein 4 homolog [Priapulus caudatus]